jgi:hypothetical protein
LCFLVATVSAPRSALANCLPETRTSRISGMSTQGRNLLFSLPQSSHQRRDEEYSRTLLGRFASASRPLSHPPLALRSLGAWGCARASRGTVPQSEG